MGKLRDSIGEMSCASFHCGFISFKNRLFTCGVGADFRLGHDNETTYYEPTFVQSLSEVKCARVECVEDRTFVTTKYGAVLMFGVEPVTRTTYRKPFVFEFLRTHRIYQVCGAKDFTVALGVQAKGGNVQQPQVETDPNVNIQLSAGAGNNRTNAQFGGIPQPPMVPLDANPGFNSFAKPLPSVPAFPNQFGGPPPNQNNGAPPNPYAMNNNFGGGFGGPPPPPGPPNGGFGGNQNNGFGGGAPPQFQNNFGGPPPGPPNPNQFQNNFGAPQFNNSRPPPPTTR